MVFEKDGKTLPSILSFQSKGRELFISKEFFVLYINSLPYYFQVLNTDFNKNELENHLKTSFLIDDLKISDTSSIENRYYNKKLPLIKVKNSYFFKIYFVYILLIISLFFGIDKKNKENIQLTNINKKIANIKNQNNFEFKSKYLLEFYSKSKLHHLKIIKIKLKNSKISTSLVSKNKKNIYDFLKEYKNSHIEKTSFNKQNNEYTTDASFRIY